MHPDVTSGINTIFILFNFFLLNNTTFMSLFTFVVFFQASFKIYSYEKSWKLCENVVWNTIKDLDRSISALLY